MISQCLLAFISGMIVLPINLSAGMVADKTYWAVSMQPIIAVAWVCGVRSVVGGFWPCFAYVIGGTLGAYLSILIRRNIKRQCHSSW